MELKLDPITAKKSSEIYYVLSNNQCPKYYWGNEKFLSGYFLKQCYIYILIEKVCGGKDVVVIILVFIDQVLRDLKKLYKEAKVIRTQSIY